MQQLAQGALFLPHSCLTELTNSMLDFAQCSNLTTAYQILKDKKLLRQFAENLQQILNKSFFNLKI